MLNRKYTDSDRARVEALVNDGVPDVDIVKITGFNLGYVTLRVKRYWENKMKMKSERSIDN